MYFSLKKSKDSRKIAKIKGGKNDGEYVYMSNTRGENEIKITDGVLQPLPNREIIEKVYISAPSGAGKSTYTGKWIGEYVKMFKDNNIFLFSSVANDRVLDRHDPTRITLDNELLNDPIEPKELANSLVIFDDVDTIRDRRMRLYLENLRDHILEVGRHYKTRILITSHLLSNYASTRRILNEATSVVLFPKSGSGTYHIKNFLKTYCGFDKQQTKKFLNLPSRWIAVYRSFPQYVMYEKGVYFPANNDE
jgi:hypothetical protein